MGSFLLFLAGACAVCGLNLALGNKPQAQRQNLGSIQILQRWLQRFARWHPLAVLAQNAMLIPVEDVLLASSVPLVKLRTRAEALAMLLVSVALSGMFLSALLASFAGMVLAVALWLTIVPFILAAHKRVQTKLLSKEMPQIMRSLSVALSSGKTLTQAIEYVGTHGQGAAATEFSRAALALHCGSSLEDALAQLESRLQAPGVDLLAASLAISQRTGCPLKDLLLSTAHMVEEKAELERTLLTKTAQTRLSIRIVCTMPVLLVVLLGTISPEFRAGCTTAAGLACLAVAGALDVLALAIVRHLMKGVNA